MISAQAYLLLLIIAANLSLGILVYLKGRHHDLKINFYFICLGITLWTVPVFLGNVLHDPRLIKLMRNLVFIGPAFIPPLLLEFSLIFPKKKNISPALKSLMFLPAFYFFGSALLELVVAAIITSPAGNLEGISRYYFNFYLFVIYFLAMAFFALYRIFRNYQQARGLEKMQLRYVGSAMFISTCGAALTNLIMPLLGNPHWLNVGPLFSLILLLAFTYSIVKHRLMDIKVFIRRGLAYFLVTIIITFAYISLLVIFEKVFHEMLAAASLPITLMTVFIIALSFSPLLEWIKKIIDRVFFPEKISHQKTLQESLHRLTSFINLRDIFNLFITVIPRELQLSSIRIFLWDESKNLYYLKSAAGDLRGKLERTNIAPGEILIDWLKKHDEPLDLEIIKNQPTSPENKEISEIMHLMAANLIVPFSSKNKLIAFLILGAKNSGEMFTRDDLALLTALADEGAVAIENAQLYQEVLDMKNYQEDILKAMAIGIISTSLDGRIVTINPRAEELLGFSQAESREKRWYEIIKNPGVKNMIPEILTTGRHYSNFEIELEQKNGQKIFVAINTSFLKNGEKKITGVLITLLDLTKIKNLEAQIRQAEKLATMGELVAGVAHEINNPLTTISCYKNILESYLKEKGTDVEVKTLDGLTTAVDHLKKVVENFLRFARKTQEVWIKTDIKKVIADALTITRPNLNVGKVEVEEKYEPDLPQIRADHVQLVQVFTNLIVNACHAMPAGGRLKITTELDVTKKEIVIQIADTGLGIPPENISKIFESFFTTKDLTKGTGLGLSVSLGIIEKHQGTIEVKSTVGSGTTFIIRLPVAEK